MAGSFGGEQPLCKPSIRYLSACRFEIYSAKEKATAMVACCIVRSLDQVCLFSV
jgi:hypothetical protein